MGAEDQRVKEADLILEKIQRSITERTTAASLQNEGPKKPFAKIKGKKTKQEKDEERNKQERRPQEEDQTPEEALKAQVISL